MDIQEVNTVIRSLSRRKNLSSPEHAQLRQAHLDKADYLGIQVDPCDRDLLSKFSWSVTKDNRVQTKVDGKRRYLGSLVMERVLDRVNVGQVSQTAEADSALDYRRSSLQVTQKGHNYGTALQSVKTADLPPEYRGIFLNDDGTYTASVVISRRANVAEYCHDIPTIDQAAYIVKQGQEAKARFYAECEAEGITSAVCPNYEVRIAMYSANTRWSGAVAPEQAEAHFVSQDILDKLPDNPRTGERPQNVRLFTTEDKKNHEVPDWVFQAILRNKASKDESEARVAYNRIDRDNATFERNLKEITAILPEFFEAD